MATLGGQNAVTLLDWAKRINPDTNSVETRIAELLSQTNAILNDMLWLPGNLPTGHRITMRTGLPAPVFRKLNAGIPRSKSKTIQVDEATGSLEDFGVIDKDVAELNGNTGAFRLSENIAHIEGMNQKMAETLFFGDHTSVPEEFLGLAPRYSTISGATNGQNILDGGGSGSDNSSIWLVAWGERSVYGIFPKSTTAGLKHTDLGLDTVDDSNGDEFIAYKDHYEWKAGIALKDWRYVVRIANIDISDLVAESSAADLLKLMIRAMDRIPTFEGVNPVYYVNRTVFSMLKIQALDKSNNALSIMAATNQFGQAMAPELNFFGIPVRKVDQLLETEAQIT